MGSGLTELTLHFAQLPTAIHLSNDNAAYWLFNISPEQQPIPIDTKSVFLQRHTSNFQDKNTRTNKFQKDIYKFMLHSFLAYNNGL